MGRHPQVFPVGFFCSEAITQVGFEARATNSRAHRQVALNARGRIQRQRGNSEWWGLGKLETSCSVSPWLTDLADTCQVRRRSPLLPGPLTFQEKWIYSFR